MKTVILTEGGGESGFGHLTRSIALAEALREKNIDSIFVARLNAASRILLRGEQFHPLSWFKNEKDLLSVIKGAGAVIIDSHNAPVRVYRQVSSMASNAIFIDDCNRIDYPRGIIINGSIYAKRLRYSKERGSRHVLGIRYEPLRKEFWGVSKKKIRNKVRRIMVTLGGSDIRNFMPKILSFLKNAYPKLEKFAVIGRDFKNKIRINNIKDPRAHLVYHPTAKTLLETMFNSDLAISAGGQTLYELARVGLPAIGICMIENQRLNLEGWRDSGWLEYIGWYNDKKIFLNLAKSIQAALPYDQRLKRYETAASTIDGQGARRIARIIAKQIT
jgi:UDP-2,4-diacetamido-2,4,6-trideoxy-beta-L-altropyranose hydrolase